MGEEGEGDHKRKIHKAEFPKKMSLDIFRGLGKKKGRGCF